MKIRKVSICLILVLLIAISSCGKKMEESSSEYNIGSISNDELVKLVNSKSGTTRLFVANVAIERGTGATLKLLNMVNYASDDVQRSIGNSTANIKDQELIRTYIAFLEHRKWKMPYYYYIWWNLKRYGNKAIDPLIKALQQIPCGTWRDKLNRSELIQVLGDIYDPRVEQALLKIFHNRRDPNWEDAVASLIKRKNETAYSIIRLTDNDPTMRDAITKVIASKGIRPIDDKRFLPVYFWAAKINLRYADMRYGLIGIARNAGKSELPRIEKELNVSDKEWVLPFVNINCAIEGVESPAQKADILWQYILDAKYYDYNMGYIKNPPYGGTEEFSRFNQNNKISDVEMLPVIYAVEKLAELGDVILPKIKEGIKSDRIEIRLRAIIALTEMPPSKASTKMMLEVLDTFKWNVESEGDIRDRVAIKLADRNEKKAIPKLIQILHEMERTPLFPSDILDALVRLGDKKVMPELIQIWQYMKDTPPVDDRYKETMDLTRTWFAGELAIIVNNWKVTDPKLIPVLMDAMSSYSHTDFGGNYYHRIAAIHDLVRIGDPAIESIKLLLNSKDRFGRNDYMNKELAETALKILTPTL